SVRRAPTATAIVAPPATPTSSTSPSQLRKFALRSARVRTQMASTLRSSLALSSRLADLVEAGLAHVPLPEAGLRSGRLAVGDQQAHRFLHAPIVLRARARATGRGPPTVGCGQPPRSPTRPDTEPAPSKRTRRDGPTVDEAQIG